MKLPMSWLRQWIGVDAAPEAVAEALTTRGFYVEGIESHGRRYPGIVIARVLQAGKHPNADKLKLCRVDSGHGELRIVCGAPNVAAGMMVPLATPGTVMPGGTVIARAKIRGEESEGMLCSARELMLSEDHAGILDLASYLPGANLAPGRPLDEVLPEPDAVLEVEVPFNRPDGMGVVGLAREVKAALAGAWTADAAARLEARAAAADNFALSIEDPADCPAYFAQVVEGVTIEPSPPWLQRRLEVMGQRPISNVVDLTNLVLFEFGQPLHAFDLDRLAGPEIRVRLARTGEGITTLDGRARELSPGILVIADAKRPVAIAGIMGGAESEVGAGTTRLLLECAGFHPGRIRRGARTLGLATEASRRYERAVDAQIGAPAAARFLSLLLELCPTAKLGPSRRLETPVPRVSIALRPARCSRLIGLQIPMARCAALLESLEFGVQPGADALDVSVPSWRPDCTIEDDLVEEVARANGYDRIPDTAHNAGGTGATRSPRERLVKRAREAMLAQGLHEAWSSSLVSAAEAAAAAPLPGRAGRTVALTNPMSRESEVLRPNLLPGLLRAVAHNQRQGAAAVRLFEVGAGFLDRGGKLPEEALQLVAVVTGSRWRHVHDSPPGRGAYDPRGPVDLLDARGLWEAWLGEMRVDSQEWRAYSAAGWKLGASAEVASGGSSIAWAGTLSPTMLQVWGIETPVHAFVALLDPLAEGITTTPRATVPGRYPPVRRDLAFFVPREVTHARVAGCLAGAAGGMPVVIELFDVYEGPGTPQGRKSLAYALQFQRPERTLTEAEVLEIQTRMVAAVEKECDGTLRER